MRREGIPFGQPFRYDYPPDSPYGANPDFPNDRGLCFVCYQRSIRDQFELIQRGWVNDEAVPEDGDGMDPVASQASPRRTIRIPGAKTDPVRLYRQWVTTGGEYFFLALHQRAEALVEQEDVSDSCWARRGIRPCQTWIDLVPPAGFDPRCRLESAKWGIFRHLPRSLILG
jgi:hypothetical protein